MNYPEGMPEDAIIMEPRTITCAAHGEHLRAQWPKGFLIISVKLFQAAASNPDLHAECRKLEGLPPDGAPEAKTMNRIFPKRPMCYWVTREQIREAFMESGIGKVGRCDACGRSGVGGDYQVSTPVGVAKHWLCFECALDAGDRFHQAHPDGQPARDA